MDNISLPTLAPNRQTRQHGAQRIALVGNPNSGKTAVFNQLTGLRAKSSNFPGTTLECRSAEMEGPAGPITLLDLPGLYSLEGGETEEELAASIIKGHHPGTSRPDAVVAVLDATNLPRQLYLASQVRELGLPMVICVTQMDLARAQGIEILKETLAQELGAPVVLTSARTGEGMALLENEIARLASTPAQKEQYEPFAQELACRVATCAGCTSCPTARRHQWAADVGAKAASGPAAAPSVWADRADHVLTHPMWGVLGFAVIMAGLFVSLFVLAKPPMDWINAACGWVGEQAKNHLQDGDFNDFISSGVITGVGSVLVFLPQICILFFMLSLLEDTGYLARAAFVMDRLMRKVGLPGRAFVPMLSAHACAIPAIMATRALPNRRDRLITILIIPLLTCSARLPVYAMVAALLFHNRPELGGLVFAGAYGLGIVAALGMAFLFRHTLLKGTPRELLIELPSYKVPSLRSALLTTWDRGLVFLKQAGTIILLISVILWSAKTYPKMPESQVAQSLTQTEAAKMAELGLQSAEPGLDAQKQKELGDAKDAITAPHRFRHAVLGRIGHAVQPAFAPLGFDEKISVGVLASFAAREVVVSTLGIVTGVGEGAERQDLFKALAAEKRADGTPLFTTATCLSLLVFFVLAMQCLPTQAITRRETGSWKWAAFQLGYMSVLAWTSAFVVYHIALWLGGGA